MKITKIYKSKGEYFVTLRDDDQTFHTYHGKSLKSILVDLVRDVVTDSNFWYTSDSLVREYTYKLLDTLSNVNYFIATDKVKQEFNRRIKHFSFVCK